MDRDRLRTLVEGIPKGRWVSYDGTQDGALATIEGRELRIAVARA